jgi:hypothetical protein
MNKKLLTSLLTVSGLAACGLSAQTIASGDITSDTTWSGTVIMDGAVFVKDGATLTINSGTIVRGQPRTSAVVTGSTTGMPGALIVTQTGRIEAEGNSDAPIIFTTAAVDNDNDGVADDDDVNGYADAWVDGDTFLDDAPMSAPLAPLNGDGDANVALWGGIVVLGNAPINLDDEHGVGYGKALVEGLTVPGFPEANATYGGLLPHDNSGTLKYVSVRHAGDEIGDSNELNGITLGGVGDGTTFEYIEVYCNFDDGIEWFGGTVNGKYLACFFIGDDNFDVDQGYTGQNQFLFAISPFFTETDAGAYGSKSGDKGFECDGVDGTYSMRLADDTESFDDVPFPLQASNFYNATMIAAAQVASPDFDVATAGYANSANPIFDLKDGFAGNFFSIFGINTGSVDAVQVTTGTKGGVFTVANNVDNGYVSIVSSTFGNVTAPISGSYAETAIDNGDALAATYEGSSNIFASNSVTNADVSFNPQGNSAGKLDASLKSAVIDPRPAFAFSGVSGGAQAQGFGLEAVGYRGAFENLSTAALWTDGWTTLSIAGLLD